MTFAEILQSCYEDCNYGSSPAAPVVTRIKKYVNDSVRMVLSEPGMTRLQDSDAPLVVTSVALQARYTLPESVAFIRGMSERTNDRTLWMRDLTAYRYRNPDPATNSGIPTHYVPFGRTAVAVQPSAAAELFVKSTAAGDTTQVARLEGIITGGYQRQVSVTLTGTVAVSLSTALTSWIEVTDLWIETAATGTVTLHQTSGAGTELARVTIGALRPRYLGFYLDPTPASVIDYLVDYRRQTLDMVTATDEPPLPIDFHPMCAAYARMREYEKVQDGRYKVASDEWTRWMNRLTYAVRETPDHLPVAGRQRPYGISHLGAWFPNDSWRY